MKYTQDVARNKTNFRNEAYRYKFVIKKFKRKNRRCRTTQILRSNTFDKSILVNSIDEKKKRF